MWSIWNGAKSIWNARRHGYIPIRPRRGRQYSSHSNSVALAVLLRQVGKHPTRVFTFRGKPVAWANTYAWRKALKRCGIENFRWHDLRHTWASWLAQQGTPMNVLQELGGWESQEMVRRYAHLSKPQLMQHAELISNVLDGTILAQSINKLD